MSIERPEHFATLRPLVFRQLLNTASALPNATPMFFSFSPSAVDSDSELSASDLWAQLVARLGWLFRGVGALGSQPGGVLHFIEHRLLRPDRGQTQHDHTARLHREHLAVLLFVQVRQVYLSKLVVCS